jgi:hypothetical protein
VVLPSAGTVVVVLPPGAVVVVVGVVVVVVVAPGPLVAGVPELLDADARTKYHVPPKPETFSPLDWPGHESPEKM